MLVKMHVGYGVLSLVNFCFGISIILLLRLYFVESDLQCVYFSLIFFHVA